MLKTPDSLGLSQTERTSIHNHWSTFDQVQAHLAMEGFNPLPHPGVACPGYLEAEVLTSHNSRTLTTEFAKYKAWRDFTADRLVYTKQILLETRNEMRAIEARIKQGARDIKRKVTKEEVLEEARLEPRYVQLQLHEQKHQQLELQYEAKQSEFSSSLALISRVITIRGQDIEQGMRGNAIGANVVPPGGGFG